MKKQNIALSTIITLLLLTARLSYGQQDPMFTQYNFNTQVINPAYAGTWESIGFLALGRLQWVNDIPGAPRTYTFSVQSPTRNENMAWGANVISDKVGKEQRLSVMGDYSYRLQVSAQSYFRFGIKAGVTHYSNPLTTYNQNPDEGGLEQFDNIDSKLVPNFGVGAYWYSDRHYLGLSLPKIMESNLESGNSSYSNYWEVRHFYFQGGYVFPINEYLRFKPTFLMKATVGAPIELDLTGNFLLGDKFWLGAMYRTGDSFGFIAQWIIDKKLRMGYSIDFTATRLQRFNSGSHELMVSYELGSRRKWSTPRMF